MKDFRFPVEFLVGAKSCPSAQLVKHCAMKMYGEVEV
jgi:hypothetical protein